MKLDIWLGKVANLVKTSCMFLVLSVSDVTHTAHQGQRKVFIKNVHTDMVVLAVTTVNELDFWECVHSCPLYCFLS